MKLHFATRICGSKTKAQAGMSLIETMVALALLLVVAAGIMSFAALALTTTENQGHLAARTAEYAQDKMEQLLALQYPDQFTDTTVFPSVLGTACPPACGLQVGGSLNPNAPAPGYSDYVDASGNPTANGANWQYIRVWQITQVTTPPGTTDLKQISVLTQVRSGVGGTVILPRSTVVCLKSKPF
jgi:prepilin-type N-terminal cleavage/methylation domain-containing protein